MLVYVATLFLSWLVHGPWRDPEGYNFPQSKLFIDSALLPILVAETRLNAAILIALATRPSRGSLCEGTSSASRCVSRDSRLPRQTTPASTRTATSGSACSPVGACAGLAGVGEAAGPIGQLLPSMSPGYGFAAIIVAFVGRLNPIGIVFASLLMSLLYLGGESAQVNLALPSAVTGLFQGTLLFFLLAADVFVNYRVRIVQPAAAT